MGAHARTAALSQLGLFALRTTELSVLAAEALRVVRKALHVDLCSVLEVSPTGDRLLRREWLGYRQPPPHTMTREVAGWAFYTLRLETPVVVDDLAHDTRFLCPPLADEGVVSGVCIVIRPPALTRQTPFGCIFAGSRSHRGFGAEDVEFVEFVAEILGSVVYRQRTEEALRKSEERFDLMSQSLHDSALFALGPDASIASWNGPAERLFGWRAEDVIGKHVSGLCGEDDVCNGVVKDLLENATDDHQSEVETFAIRADGTSFRAQLVAHRLRGERDRGIALFVRNITARYEAERTRAQLTSELERHCDTLQAVIEQIPAGVVFHDATDKHIQFMSRRLAVMYGYEGDQKVDFEEIVSRFPTWFPDGRRIVVEEYAGVRALSGETIRQELEVTRPDGTKSSVIDSGSPVYDRHGQLVGSVAAVYDITAEKEAARERERLLEETKRAVLARDDTIAVVSHDLRNPVSVVALAGAQLEARADTLDAAGVRTIAGRIQRAASTADKIIGDLLDFSRIEMGRMVVDPTEHDAHDVIAEAVDAFAELAAQRDISLTAKLDAVASVRLRCDRSRIVQALSNLLGNALKFVAPGRGIEVEGRLAEHELVVSVRDQGPGLAPEQLVHVFDRYWQANAQEARRGLGLGLAIVKGIIDAHAGRVWAESVLGQGATFSFALPIDA